MENAEIISHTVWQKFRENNGFTKEITKYLVTYFSVRKNFSFFHTVISQFTDQNQF